MYDPLCFHLYPPLSTAVGEPTSGGSSQKPKPVASRQDVYAGKVQSACRRTLVHQLLFPEQLSAIADFSKLGPLFKSSEKPVELTESETEYMVRCVKHTFLKHIVFQVREEEGGGGGERGS